MELEFSIMASNGAGIQPLLDRFAEETGIHVRLRLLAWDSAWGMFVRSALYGDGPDVSELGTTWVGDLIGMNALRPFSAAEIAALGRASAFFAPAWKTGIRPAGAGAPVERVWAIPWLAGARLVFYRPALFARAGIDPEALFQPSLTPAGFRDAVYALREAGAPVPWTAPTGYTHTTLLNIASWVWAAGGDFIEPGGKATAFTQPAALDGMEAYFALGGALAGEVRGLNGLEPDDYFLAHAGAAMTMSGPWLAESARGGGGDPAEIRAALPPGPSFVGGSNLIVWKHTRTPQEAVRLVHFLTQHAAQVQYARAVGLLPARVESLDSPPFTSDPYWKLAARGLRTGRTFPAIRLWGLVEDRLTAGFTAVWNDVLAGMAPRAALEAHLAPLAERLDGLLRKE